MSKITASPKQRILDTVTVLFHKQGYQSTGINQIVTESGVVKSTLYQYFHSKENLAAAYLNERHQKWFDLFYSFTSSATSPVEKILAAFDFVCFMNEKENYAGCAFIKMAAEIQSENEVLNAIIKNHKIELKEYFSTLQADLQINSEIVYLLFESAMLESHLFKNDWPVSQAKNIIKSLIN